MKPALRLSLLLGGAVVLAGAGVWAYQARTAQHLVAAALPVPPDLESAPPVFREAVRNADARARTFGRAAGGLESLAALYHANGRYAEALACYEGLRQLDPDEPRWHHLPATLLAGYGRADEAIALWERTLQLAPDYLPARLRLGDILLKVDRDAEAAAAYEAALRTAPDDPYARLGLARLDFEAGRLDEARRRLEAVVSDTNGTLGYDLIVTLYERLGLNDRALALRAAAKASGAHRDPPDPWADALLAVCHDPFRLALAAGTIARDGRPGEAMELLRRAIELAPNDVAVRFQLALLARDQNDIATAREQLHQCTALAPGFADGWYHLSVLQHGLGERTAAERTLGEGLRRCPDSPGLHLLQAQRLRDANRIGESITAFQTSIRLRPNEPEAYLELGNLLIRLGREAEAVRNYRRAWEVEPGNPAALSLLTFNAIASGDEAEARRWMAQVALQPRLPRPQAEALRAAFREKFGRDP
jgi:tetratricopeptide (TPR) repeat protein